MGYKCSNNFFFGGGVVECVVGCPNFIEVSALGLTIAALSSYDHNMRAAAYHVLGSFRFHLEGARFREQRQVRICYFYCFEYTVVWTLSPAKLKLV